MRRWLSSANVSLTVPQPVTRMLASSVLLGVAAGFATGGRFARLGQLQIAWWPLLAIAMFVRLLPLDLGTAALPAYLIAFATILAVAVRNVRLPGMPLICIGAALNLVVVAVNGAMPVDMAAASAAGMRSELGALHEPLDQTTQLAPLADLIPIPVIARVYSIGDAFLAAGGFWLPFAWMKRP